MNSKSNSSFSFNTISARLSSQPPSIGRQRISQMPPSTASASSSSFFDSSGGPDLPDLSHLSEDERRIIEAVMERQRAEEANIPARSLTNQNISSSNNSTSLNKLNKPFNSNNYLNDPPNVGTNLNKSNTNKVNANLNANQNRNVYNSSTESLNDLQLTQKEKHQQLQQNTQSLDQKLISQKNNTSNLENSQRHSISDIAQEVKQRYGSIDTGNVCDICKKTKFSNGGVGHVCFSCKSSCCVRCAFRYTTKTKQLWACIECKKKQEALLKSGQWLNSLNNKNYSSDYILNKAAAAGININNIINSSNTNVNNTDETIPNPKQQPQKQLPSIPNSNKRQLPKLNSVKQKSIDQENLSIESDKSSSINLNTNNKNVKNLSNSALSVPELAGDDSYSTNSNLEPNKKSNDTTNSNSNNNNNSTNNNLLSRRSNRSMKQPLIKQISLNNPPTYYQQLNDDDESTLYENLSKSPNKSFTSNHELRNANSQYINDQYFSSPTSSISQLNTSLTSRTSINRRVERMQDPLLAFKNKASNSRLNSATDLNAIDTDEAVLYNKEKSLNQINKKELSNLNNEIKKSSTTSLNKTETDNISSANQTGIVDKNNNNDSETNNENKKLNAINRNNLYPPLKQRAKELLHTDSLSSDPSDIQAASNQIIPTSQSEFNNKSANLDETGMQRKHSKTKRSTRQRKQPAIPINSSLALHQQKIFAKLNLKQQNSLTSSDENLNDDYDLVQKDKKLRIGAQDIENINENEDASNELEQTDFLEDEEDENEDANNVDDDVDEEIRSTTEYTTNDEMDLESGSVSISANALANNNNNKNSSKINRAGSNLQSSEFTSLDNNKNSIDDYLMQNLEKDEILAAKMSKFLSPTNWQISSDGKKIIGYIILKRTPSITNNNNSSFTVVNSSSCSTIDSSSDFNTSQSLGLKIIGGRANPITNQLSAYIVRIKKNSVADTVGGLQLGDEVIKWNGKLLRGLTYDEVYSIMSKSKNDSQVELVVERPIDDIEREKLKNLINDSIDNKKSMQISNKDSDNQTSRVSSTLNSKPNEAELKKPIGKIQLKIFHDSIENKLFINVLNININQFSHNQTCMENFSNNQIHENKIQNILCKLHLYPKKQIDFYTKLSEVCNLDDITGLFIVNEAFTFDSVNIDDLKQLTTEIELINYSNKDLFGKLKIELDKEMFDNKLMNLDIFPPSRSNNLNSSNNSNDINELASHKLNSSHGLSVESINSGSNNNKRRQLPQIPMEKQKENRDKVAIDLVDKARKIKLDMKNGSDQYSVSDSETMMAQFKTFTTTTTTPSFTPIQKPDNFNTNANKMNEPEFLKENTDRKHQNRKQSDDLPLFLNNTNNNPDKKPPHSNSLLRQDSSSPISHPHQSQSKPANLNKLTHSDLNGSNEYLAEHKPKDSQPKFHENDQQNQQLYDYEADLYEDKARTSSMSSVGTENKKTNLQTLSSPQLWHLDKENAKLDMNKLQKPNHPNQHAYLSSSAQAVHDEDDLYLKSNNKAHQHINSNHSGANTHSQAQNRASNVSPSPSETFGTSFQPLSNTSQLNRSMPNSVVNNIGGVGVSGSASMGGSGNPEKLFSSRLLNQRTGMNMSKNMQQNIPPEPMFGNAHPPAQIIHHPQAAKLANGIDTADSDGSDNSQQSKSSASGQSEFLKGANTNNINNNKNKTISGLTASDGNRFTTVATNPATSATTTTTLINNTPSNMDMNDISLAFGIQPTPQTNKAKPVANPTNPYSDKTDGTLSDSALTNPVSTVPENTNNKKRRPSMAKALVILGLSKKSNSASNLAYGKRFGFARSEEYGVAPELRSRTLSSTGSGDSSGGEDKTPKTRLWSGALKLPHELPFNEFIERLGPGQKVSRQVLGLPCLGEVKMILFTDKQKLNIEIVEAKNLKQKTTYRILPSVYVKLYLFRGSCCIEKQKTTSQRRTVSPTYQETLKFESDYRGTVLQVTVWGDYGKLDRKIFMGIAQIVVDDINLSGNDSIVGWYKLYSVNSILDYSTIASAADLNISGAESGYSLSSQKAAMN